mmetsp:Transcript_2397/g.9251  ORF Transcript_2397/g.9251 Transcript_2397/m.9251 type:complete len:387 (-) Transcript_2397:1397-2557(-)
MSCACGPFWTRLVMASSKACTKDTGNSRSAPDTASIGVLSSTSATSASSVSAPRKRSDMSSARRASPSFSAKRAARGVTSSPRSVGSNWHPTSRLNTITPSLVLAHQPLPVGAKETCLHRIFGRFLLAFSPALAPTPKTPPPPAPGMPPFVPSRFPRSPRRRPSSSSLSLPPEGSRSRGPASVTLLLSRRSMTPSKALDFVNANFFNNAWPFTSYMHTTLASPPASSNAPSALYARVLKFRPAAMFEPLRRSPITFPPAMSRLPSIVPSSLASLGSHRNTCPSNVALAICFPSGRNATHNTSCACGSTSVWPRPSYTSHIRTVLSHDPETKTVLSGENASDVTGPWWPARMSSSRPVFRLQMKIWKVSTEPAQTTSPVGSTARDTN